MNTQEQVNKLVDYLENVRTVFNSFEKYSILSINVTEEEIKVHVSSMSFFSFWNGEELTISDIDSQIDVEDDPITKNISFYRGEVEFFALFSKFEFQKWQEKMNSPQ